jgi:hypothetical protein
MIAAIIAGLYLAYELWSGWQLLRFIWSLIRPLFGK